MNFLIITLTILSLIALTTYSYKEGARNMYSGVTVEMPLFEVKDDKGITVEIPIFQAMVDKAKDKTGVLKDIHYFNNTTNLLYAWERLPS